MNPSDEDPARLLREDAQWTAPWGGSEDGCSCDKCGGTGRALHECWSCVLAGVRQSCPACAGKLRWEAECPVCRGTGVIDGKPRRGVSVFPTAEGLYRYMIENDADLDGCVIVELEGERAQEVDFDADQGAVLVIPTRICACAGVQEPMVARVRNRIKRLPAAS